MEFPKIQKEIYNPISENVKKLAELFPSAVRDGQVDFEALKKELGEFEAVSDKLSERYELGWAGKAEAKQLANKDIVGKTLKYIPEDSKNPDTTGNLYIEGDNLEVLKLLRNSYYNKIKMIYIDPPYNTGNDFIYKDNFAVSEKENSLAEGEIDEAGERLIVNQKSSGKYHSNWLSMMYPRLRVAKDLLAEDGVIFISIDDNEVHNLRKICDENSLFGEENFVSQLNWKGRGGRQDSKHFAVIHEYILCYAKNIIQFSAGEEIKEGGVYPKYDDVKKRYYKTQLARKWGSNSKRSDRPNLFYAITAPDGTDLFPMLSDTEEGCWRWSKTRMEKEIQAGNVEFVKNGEKWVAYEKIYKPLEGEEATKKYTTWIDNIGTGTGTDVMKNIFGIKAFDYPKPVDLVKRFILMANVLDNALVLDFFAGSSTTAHAVMQLNAEDGGNRKFIMVQLPEPCDEKSEAYKAGFKNISEIGKERIRRAGEKIKEENKDKEGIEDLDIGFKVFKVADTNIRWFSEALQSDQMVLDEAMMTDKDKLDFNPGYTDIDVVYEILLRHRDIPLSTNVEKLSSIGARTYIFADTVVVCLEETITEGMIDQIAAIEPMPTKVIFRDSAFGDDISLKTNSMLRLEAQMKKHSGLKKKAYRVEFI
jgi:adenine-specific DNA-methyltransferase